MSLRRRLLARATGNQQPMTVGADWVWPYWLERQLDPESPAHVSPGQQPRPANVTARHWTVVGNLDSPREATVDPRGLVTPHPGGWSLDWWIGADDRWHLPSREVAVRQRLLDDMPVVETAMRVPGGDAVQRVYAVRQGEDELVVVEVENQSPVPFALALAVRPANAEGLAPVRAIAVVDDGHAVSVDGQVAMLLPKPPARLAGSTGAQGDVADTVLAGEAGTSLDDLGCPDGRATAAFIWPVAHRTTLRVVLPLTPSVRPVTPGSLPAAEQVANGWRVQGERGLRLVLPDPRLQAAVDAARRFLLIQHDRDDVPLTDAFALLGALDRCGYAREAAQLLRALPERQRPGGSFGGRDDTRSDGAALAALAEHWRLHRDAALLEEVVPSVAPAAESIERVRHRRRRRDDGTRTEDDLWGLRGLLDAQELLAAAGEGEGAEAAGRFAATRRDELLLDAAVDPTAVLEACWPLRLIDADDAALRAAVEAVRQDVAVADDPQRVMQLAMAELAVGDRRALGRVDGLLDAASPTWRHDASATADLLSFVRHVLVRESEGGGLALCSLWADAWFGQGVEVHDAPTHVGVLSFAIRWHGDRPALLWELDPHPGAGEARLTAPGLDPSWSSTERTGDALLSPVLPPGTPVSLKRG